jgi:hypothetical protein
MKAETGYSEKERLMNMKTLSNFNINPFAALMVFEDYAHIGHPLPIKYVWEATGKDEIIDPAAKDVGRVELYIITAGYVGNRLADVSKMDRTALNLLCQSYYKYCRPAPISFQLANAVEFHIRTPGESDFGKHKNPLRDIKI